MDKIANSLHAKVHTWTDAIGFNLNTSLTNNKNKVTTKHYFFETFNFIERYMGDDPLTAKFLCFDTYGERVTVNTLLDLQVAFFDNISKLK